MEALGTHPRHRALPPPPGGSVQLDVVNRGPLGPKGSRDRLCPGEMKMGCAGLAQSAGYMQWEVKTRTTDKGRSDLAFIPDGGTTGRD